MMRPFETLFINRSLETAIIASINSVKSRRCNLEVSSAECLLCIYNNGFSGAVSRGKAIFRFLKKKLIILFIREMHVSIHLKHEEIKNANENTLFVQLV